MENEKMENVIWAHKEQITKIEIEQEKNKYS